MLRRTTWILTSLLALGVPFPVSAQDAAPAEKDDGPGTSRVEVEMALEHIRVTFLVRDDRGHLIRNLSKDDFVVLENGRPQTVTLLEEQEVPINVAVMVDTSWSLQDLLKNAVETAIDFFRGLENESAAVVRFSRSPELILDWDERPQDIRSLMARVSSDGKTALYDSVIWVCRNVLSSRSGKKVVVLISDGIDTASRASFREMIRISRQEEITVYPIIYTNQFIQNYRRELGDREAPVRSNISRAFHRFVVSQNRFLEQTRRYGGRTIFSDAFLDLRQIYRDIIEEMKSHYVLYYQSDGRDEGGSHEVRMFTRRVPGRIFVEFSQ